MTSDEALKLRRGERVRIKREGYPPFGEVVEVREGDVSVTRRMTVVRLAGYEGFWDAALLEASAGISESRRRR